MKTTLRNCFARFVFAFAIIGATTAPVFGQGTIIFNHPPIIEPQTVTLDEDGSVAIHIVAHDPDGDPLQYYLFLLPTILGNLTGTLPDVTYQPPPNYSGQAGIFFFVSDGKVLVHGSVGLIVQPINDPPTAQIQLPNAVPFAGYSDQVVISGRCNAGDKVVLDGTESGDVDGDLLTFKWREGSKVLATTASVTNGFSPGRHEVELSVSDGTLSNHVYTTFRVITPCEAIAAVQDILAGADVPRHKKQPLSALLNNALRALMRGNTHASGAELVNFHRHVNREISPQNLELAAILNDSVESILCATGVEKPSEKRLPTIKNPVGSVERRRDIR